MGIVIYVQFRKHHYTLRQARDFLGSGWFRKALFEWSLEELDRTLASPEAFMSDAGDAYHAILTFRQARLAGPVIPLPFTKGAEIIQLFGPRKRAA